MGNINKFRPSNGGRSVSRNSPSFLVCALFIGLCIITVSYYNLSSQYTKMYDSMTDLVKQHKMLEAHLKIRNTEEENEKIKEKQLHKILEDTKLLLDAKTTELLSLRRTNIKTINEVTKKKQELIDAQFRIKELEDLKTQLNEEINKQKEQIDELNKKLFPAKNANDINLQDKQGLDPKRKIVDNNLPLNQANDNKDALSKDAKSAAKSEDDKKSSSKMDQNKQDSGASQLVDKNKN